MTIEERLTALEKRIDVLFAGRRDALDWEMNPFRRLGPREEDLKPDPERVRSSK